MADSKLTALSEISVPALEDLLYTVDDPSGTPVSNKVSGTRYLGMLNRICDGRLTLTSGTAITTSDVTAATSVYFTPYNGNKIAIYDGTRWKLYSFTELTLALGTLTASLPYDVFIYDNAGTLTLEALAWTNGTTRATSLASQDGVWVKAGATTRRYLGTFYTTSTTTTEDSVAKRFLYNAHNRVSREVRVVEATGSWTYNSTTIRQARGSSANQIEMVRGLAEGMVDIELVVATVGDASAVGLAALGYDSTTAISDHCISGYPGYSSTEAIIDTCTASLNVVPAVGYHYVAWIEKSSAASSVTFYGNDTSSVRYTGIEGEVES